MSRIEMSLKDVLPEHFRPKYCGGCLFFEEIKKNYSENEIKKGKCVNEVYLKDNPKELVVMENEIACGYFKESELNLKR